MGQAHSETNMAARQENESRTPQIRLAQPSRPSALDWDRNELIERLDGDQEFLCDLLQIFRDDCDANLQNARTALRERDLPGLMHVAHTMKGMLKSLCMNRAGEIAHALETCARQQQSELAESLLVELESAIAELLPMVDARLVGVSDRKAKA
jgi:HPt (histidine-containing phosphotransfer) domain-containing protein